MVLKGVGPVGANLMFVGEAPGEQEADDLLTEMLVHAGIDRKETYITNVVKARPTVDVQGVIKNRPPTQAEINQHKPWLWDEIQLVKPKVIVCLGKVPTKLLLKIDKAYFTMKKYLGQPFDSQALWGQNFESCKLMAAWHPSYLLIHGTQYVDDEIKYFEKAKEIANGSSS